MAAQRIRGLFLSACLLWAAPSSASPILDQFYIPAPPNGLLAEDGQTLAQTFTVGLAGLLSAIELDLACCLDSDGLVTFPTDLLIEIRTTLPDGSPSDDVLATIMADPRTLSVGSFEFERFSLGSQKFAVEPGDVLAIVLSSTAPAMGLFNPYAWAADFPGLYERGFGYIDNGRGDGFREAGFEFGFKTYVPEPASLTLVALGLAAMAGLRRFRLRRPTPSV